MWGDREQALDEEPSSDEGGEDPEAELAEICALHASGLRSDPRVAQPEVLDAVIGLLALRDRALKESLQRKASRRRMLKLLPQISEPESILPVTHIQSSSSQAATAISSLVGAPMTKQADESAVPAHVQDFPSRVGGALPNALDPTNLPMKPEIRFPLSETPRQQQNFNLKRQQLQRLRPLAPSALRRSLHARKVSSDNITSKRSGPQLELNQNASVRVAAVQSKQNFSIISTSKKANPITGMPLTSKTLKRPLADINENEENTSSQANMPRLHSNIWGQRRSGWA